MCVCLSISNSRFNYCKQQNHCLYPKRTSVLRTTSEIKRVIFFFFIVHHNSLELSFPPFCPLFHIILICHHFSTRRMSRPSVHSFGMSDISGFHLVSTAPRHSSSNPERPQVQHSCVKTANVSRFLPVVREKEKTRKYIIRR